MTGNFTKLVELTNDIGKEGRRLARSNLDLATALQGLIEWEAQQGSYEARCWTRARAELDKWRAAR